MHRPSINRAVVWTTAVVLIVLLAVTATAVTVASDDARTARGQTVSNGGARHWVAFDPSASRLGQVQFLETILRIVNTSTARNAFTIYYEPAHTRVCAGTLAPGASNVCGLQPRTRLSGGYFLVRAAQPVLMGGHRDVPVLSYARDPASGAYGADTSRGTIQHVPFDWQPGCPPTRRSGCPDGSIGRPGGNGQVGSAP